MQVVVVDHDFLKTMGIGVVAGRPLTAAFETDAQEAVLLNEAAVKNLGWHAPEEALGRQIRFLGNREQHWLNGFAYRVDFGLGIIGLTGVLVLLIALLTVSYQATKAALADPVKSLRYE